MTGRANQGCTHMRCTLLRRFLHSIAFVAALGALVSCGGDDEEDRAASTTTERSITTTREEPTTTTGQSTTTVPPTVPDVLWHSYEDAVDMLSDVDLSPIVAGLDAQEASPDDDWLVVGVTGADRFGNVGVTVASPNELGDGVRVDLLSDSVVLYASIRKAPQDVWAFARLVGNDPVEAAKDCAQSILQAIDDDDLVVLCYVYDNRDRFDAEGRNDAAESPSGLICGRAFGTAGGGNDEPQGQDLGIPDVACPAGMPDDIGAGIERVPLPPGAVAAVTDEDGTGGPADADARAFNVPGSILADLIGFYDTAMPVGAPWLNWSWCERQEMDNFDQRVWTNFERSGTGILRVSLGEDPEDGPYIVVARHGSCSLDSN